MSASNKKISSSTKILGLQVGISLLLIGFGWMSFKHDAVTNDAFSIVKTEKQKALDIGKLDSQLKSLQLSVVQVQQFLTDVSATRAMDGLDDGYELAEKYAKEFDLQLRDAKELASTLKEDGIANQLQTVGEGFPPYYSTGKQMAAAYVAEGPAGGNKMMASFDAVASKLTGDLATAIETTTRRKSEIEEAGMASVSSIEGKLQSDRTFFQTLMTALGGLAFAFSVATAIITAVLQRQAMRQEQRAEELNRIQTQEREERARQSALVINNLGDGLGRLSTGDLSARIETPFPGELDQLRDHFNTSIRALNETIVSVMQTSDQIKAGTSEIAGASGDLARRTENQAASLEEAAATIGQLTSALKDTASNSAKARASALSARESAETGGGVVRRTVDSMREIASSAEQMTKIIGVIDEIALQTNLLALNAGVEAARAGDAGKGFAVVATEVRALSDRSAMAAKDIKRLLEESNAKVEQGVSLVGEVGTSLSTITEQVLAVATIIEDISQAAAAQSDSLSEVNAAVNQLDQFTQANAAMVEEATAATHTLDRQTAELAQVIGKFKTDYATAA